MATLTTDHLILRPFVLEDAPRVRELAGDPDVALMTTRVPHPYEEGMAEEWIASLGGEVVFAVVEAEGRLVGAVGLRLEPEHRRAELGFWIGKPYWGRGYATEAGRAVVDHGFRDLGLERIYARHLPENPASGRVLEKIGMRREGVLRKHAHHRGERQVDMVIYGILSDELDGGLGA